MATGDTFITGDYLCTIINAGNAHIQANDKSLTSYATPPREVTYQGQRYDLDLGSANYPDLQLQFPGCFENCVNLVTAPNIPKSSNPRVIYDDLSNIFRGCTSLTSIGSLPENTDFAQEMFSGCTSLTGEIVLNINPKRYWGMFRGTEKGIWLTGTSQNLAGFAATATNGNVFVGEIPLDYSLTAERVGSDGGTTPEPEGNWLHLVTNISWSNFAANSIDSMVLMINGTSISATAYTDATKTEAITLPGWRPAAQAEAHAWIQVDADTQVITFTVSDAYHTGKPITITVPQAFRTFDFLKGGKGITAGAIAEEEGFHFAMEPFFRTLAGVIQMYAGTTPPNGWAFCDGSELSISDYPELFAAIGNTYGVASDTSHFILPDLQSRFPIGADSSYPPGDTGGSADAIVPYHRHSVPAVTNAITGGSHHHATYRKKNAGSGSAIYVPDGGSTSNGISTTDTTHTHNLPAHNTAYEGDPLVGANIPPYLGINFIIHLGRPTRSI